MDELERQIRESLQQRSEDVEPTPALWSEVERRIGRRRWVTGGAWVLGTAAAVLAAIAIVPSLLQGPAGPDIADRPPAATPTQPSDDGTDGPVPAAVVGDADGDLVPDAYVAVEASLRTTLRDTVTDEVLAELIPPAEAPGPETVVEGVAVRPGSTVDDLAFALAIRGEGAQEVRLIEWTPADGATRRNIWVAGDEQLEVTQTLAWDEQGRWLAWTTPDALRIASIDELRAVSTDLADIGEDVGRTVPVGVEDHVVRDWTWDEVGDDGAARGRLELASGRASATIELEVDADGTFRPVAVLAEPDAPVHGTVDGHLEPGTAAGPRYTLDVEAGELRLRWSDDADAGAVALGGDLADSPEVWHRANGVAVLVGKTDGVWLALRDAEPRALPGEVTVADLVPPLRD